MSGSGIRINHYLVPIHSEKRRQSEAVGPRNRDNLADGEDIWELLGSLSMLPFEKAT